MWTPELLPATSDVVYEASYTKNPVTVSDEPIGTEIFGGIKIFGVQIIKPIRIQMSQALIDVAALGVLVLFYVVAVALPIGVIVLIKCIRRARR